MTDYQRRLILRYSAPSTEPVTLAEAKLFLKIDNNSDDTVITDLIAAVRVAAEDYMRRSLITQSWKIAYNDWLPDEVALSHGPVSAITSVTIYDADGSSAVVSPQAYHLDAAKQRLVSDALISGHQIDVIYVTGYGAASDVPKSIKQAMLIHMAELYDQRNSNSAMPQAARAIYEPFRQVYL